VLRYHADLPIVQVANLMGCAPGTAKSLTNKAMRSLRSELPVHRPRRYPMAPDISDLLRRGAHVPERPSGS